LLVGLLLAVSLHAFAELAIVTALPIISRDLDGATLYGVAFSAYLLTSIISIVWSGHMTDEKGPVIPFVVGLIIFSAGLIWAGLAPSMWVFVLARAVQGLGGGAFSAVIYASINRGWQDHERPHIMALLSAAWVIPGLLAPAAAGAIAEFWSWRLVFFILLPFVAVTLTLSLKGLRALGAGEVHDTGADKTVDAFRIAVGISIFLAAITRAFDVWSLPLALVGIWLAYRPLGRALPPGEGISRRILLAALGVKFLLVFGFFGADMFLPLGLIEIHGLTAYTAGIVMTVASLSWSGAAFVQSRFATTVSPREFSTCGMVLGAVSVALLALLLLDGVPYWWGFVFWALAGAGAGIVYNTVATSAMAHTIKGKEGATSVALGLAEGISIALVAGIGGAVLNGAERQGASLGLGIGIIWIFCALVIATGAVVSWYCLERKVRDIPEEEAEDQIGEDHASLDQDSPNQGSTAPTFSQD
jgi:MFS family permease